MNEQQINMPAPDWANATDISCACGHRYFIEVYMLKKFSKILTGLPEDRTVPVAVLKCDSCGKLMEELLPPQLRPKNKPII